MIDDDATIGRILSRREALALLGSAGLLILSGCRSGSSQIRTTSNAPCIVRPEQTEGPYFVDEMLNRSDIRPDPVDGSVAQGVPVEIRFNVSRVQSGSCTPLPGVHVDLWNCDAQGIYSGVRDRQFDTVGRQFLRGYQVTDDKGNATFTTIYPGWYRGRTVHVHFKIRSAPSTSPGFDFTSQLYFDDGLTDEVLGREPYVAHGPRSTRNDEDGIYLNDGGGELMLALAPKKPGYAGAFNVALEV